MIRLRSMRRGDYAGVERLLHQLQEIHIAGRPELYGPTENCLHEDFFRSMLSNGDMIAIVAQSERSIIGVCIASMLNYSGAVRVKTACIDQLVVDERWRRQGIGRALLKEAEKRAASLGATRLDTIVWSFNGGAKAAYEKCGMTPQRIIYEKAIHAS